ncbi:holo-ACP synthase [Trueperella sp. LYQ143]|uniref:holo-ACP synthase AcpS n=1 Tax=unclassified Trueperella TaxID=2630174 RepID=UPI003982FA60
MRRGIGIDLVHIPSFQAQMEQPGTQFAHVFTARERRDSGLHTQSRPSSPPPARTYASLAARWAAKEAAVKAWSDLLFGEPPMIAPQDFSWSDVEVIRDAWHRPQLRWHGQAAAQLEALATQRMSRYCWSVSLSHDVDYAVAWVAVSEEDASGPLPTHDPSFPLT